MSADMKICSIDPDLQADMSKFRMRKEKTVAAKIMKIDAAKCTVILDEEYEDTTIDELREELPQQPRYIALSYVRNHDDGRVSYPLIFFYISPPGCNPGQHMMYAGSKTNVEKTLGFTKVIELRSPEDFTEDVILEYLKRVG